MSVQKYFVINLNGGMLGFASLAKAEEFINSELGVRIVTTERGCRDDDYEIVDEEPLKHRFTVVLGEELRLTDTEKPAKVLWMEINEE